MTTEKPNVSPTGRYSYAQTARLLDVHPLTVSRWAKAGKMRYNIHKFSHRPYVTGLEILRVWNA